MRVRTAGSGEASASWLMRTISALSWFTTGRGVPAVVKTPNQALTSNSGKPCSAKGSDSGSTNTP